MHVGLSNKNLYWKVESAVQDFYDDGKINLSEINKGVEELIDGVESCLTMISNRKELTDEQFYEMLLNYL